MKPSIATRYHAIDKQARPMPTIWQATMDTTCSKCDGQIKKGALHTMTRQQKKVTLYRVCKQCRPFTIIGKLSDDID